MENAVKRMEDEGVESYILDLRNNPVSLFLSQFLFRSSTVNVFLILILLFSIGWISKSWSRCGSNLVGWRWNSRQHYWSRGKCATNKYDPRAFINTWPSCSACEFYIHCTLDCFSFLFYISRFCQEEPIHCHANHGFN